MINRGYCDIRGIAERSRLDPDLIEECLRQGVEKNLCFEHPFAYPKSYILSQWGMRAVEMDSLRRLAELSREGLEPLWD